VANEVARIGSSPSSVEVRYGKNHAYYRFKIGESGEEFNRRQLAWFAELPDAEIVETAQ
jgi:hypothetical protein